jgi:hypothetical protein
MEEMKMGRKRTTLPNYNLDKLCEMVNEKYNLKPNEIGSVELYSDMYGFSLIQLCNQYRGHRVLISGRETILKQYLRNILDDKLILNFWAV